MSKTSHKTVVEVFSEDASGGGYIYTRSEHFSAQLSNERMSEAISSALPLSAKRIIDLGCGDGTYTSEYVIRDKALLVLGIDPAPDAIGHARRLAEEASLAGCEFRQTAIDELPEDTTFDVAILRGVLHHLDDPASAVRKALRVAEQVIILEPNGLNPALKVIEKLSPYHRLHGERSFLPSLVKSWVEMAGGRVTSRRFINFVPMFCPAPAARLLKTVEPIVEALPIFRSFMCGQMVIVAERRSR